MSPRAETVQPSEVFVLVREGESSKLDDRTMLRLATGPVARGHHESNATLEQRIVDNRECPITIPVAEFLRRGKVTIRDRVEPLHFRWSSGNGIDSSLALKLCEAIVHRQ